MTPRSICWDASAVGPQYLAADQIPTERLSGESSGGERICEFRPPWGLLNAYRPSLHACRGFSLCRHRVPQDHERDPQSGWLAGLPARRHRGAGRAGARSPATCWRRNTSARRAFRPRLKRVEENDGPLLPLAPVPGDAPRRPAGAARGGETCATQVFDRLAGTWTYWGWKGGYFDGEEDAQAFYDEMRFMLAARWPRPTARNGSTPACTGPMASTAPPRATTTSISQTGELVASA